MSSSKNGSHSKFILVGYDEIIYDKDSVNIKVGARRAVKFSDADQPALHRSLKVFG